MKSYIRWIIFGVIALGIIALLVLVGLNTKLRQQLVALLLEQKTKNEIADLQEQAIVVKTKADIDKLNADQLHALAKKNEEAISKKKEALQKTYESKGMSADEIATRFRNLSI